MNFVLACFYGLDHIGGMIKARRSECETSQSFHICEIPPRNFNLYYHFDSWSHEQYIS